ncbi:MAG: hypothetical protein LBH48_06675 [Bifidobacteriaceae bacterium]|jgi:hypothetical protein|nr:hypothetical protein [Bifidobacteriaceae bacterium]
MGCRRGPHILAAFVSALTALAVCTPADAVPPVGAASRARAVSATGVLPLADAAQPSDGVSAGGGLTLVDAGLGVGGVAGREARRVKIAVVRWNIKRSVSVPLDLGKAATNVGLGVSRKKNQVFTKRMGTYYVGRIWNSATKGMTDPMDVKIGTARLAAPAKANMVVPIGLWNNAMKSFKSTGSIRKRVKDGQLTLVCFKGSRKAVLYGKYQITVQKQGKVRKAGRKSMATASPLSFKAGKKYRATVYPKISFDKISPGYGVKPAVVYKAKTRKYIQSSPPLTAIYYENGIHQVQLDLSFPKMKRSVPVVIKNTRQRLSTRLDAGNPIYQAASNLVGTRSKGCAETVEAAVKATKLNRGYALEQTGLRLSLAAARTGDVVLDVGHAAILTGPGAMAIHGDVNSHRTFRAKAPLRGAYAVERPYSNLFY